jgi:hypothetical protein
MAAGLGFKTFATGDVLTAGDTNGYLMQGVLVFADAAARTAAITSPQEGQTSYLKDTDVIQVYSGSAWVTKSGGSPLTTKGDLYTYSTTDARLGVGTNGQILNADSTAATGLAWVNAPASYTSIASGTLSGAAVTISSISGVYKDLVLYLAGITQSTSSTAYISLNNAANVGSSNIYSSSLGTGTTGSYLWIGSSSGYNMNTSAAENSFVYTISNYAATTRKAVFGNGGYRFVSDADIRGFIIYGDCSATSAITRLDIATSSGTFSGGSYALFGVK